MKIVVVDGFTLNPGDISWQGLKALGDCQIYQRTAAQDLIERCADAEAILTNKVVFSDEVMAQLPALKYLGVMATGYNVVDVDAAARRGIVVTNTPAYGTASVAQFVFAQLLQWAQPVGYYDQTVKARRWSRSDDFCYYDHNMMELAGKTLGLIGYGAIGRQVARIGLAFGMKVLVNTRTTPAELPSGVDSVSLDELASRSDVISLHCPLTADNAGFVNAEFLSAMKSSAFLINTGRGPLIDESALYDALVEQRIAGAALDVLATEPPPSDHPLFSLSNCTITPHIAWATREARQRLMDIAVDNLQAFVDGASLNRVDNL
ncbi:D-2-hydroxyacid dehydrogenase [Aestuariicella sp. G3-2]|uniref:D-2-hydroxyacid dehydrogenase n=1 Tax=Pseudomaricurvus albidus TaxID=2842452 RepID=UPI001C0BDB88|nr:D-2-hydroxyacid dehydrogenase [Aestuariicella albida]MBU3069427.1 D-2-hydroxyacid dehydrogenase [Aestuariicella albida]